jgi:hypothetical protein
VWETVVAFYNGYDLPALVVSMNAFSHYLVVNVLSEEGEIVESVKPNDKTESTE